MCWLVSDVSEDNEETVSMKTELLITSTTSAVHGKVSGYSDSLRSSSIESSIFIIFALFYHLRYCKSLPTTSSEDIQVQSHNLVQGKNMILGRVSGWHMWW